MAHPEDFITDFHGRLADGGLDHIVDLYSADGEVVRYDGVASTPTEIREYYRLHLARHPGYALRSIDQMRAADDVVMWDASIDTEVGVLQVVHVVVFDQEGAIRRHIPGLRGYWGQ